MIGFITTGYSTRTGERESRPFQWGAMALALCFLFIHALYVLCTANMPTPVHGQESSTCWSLTLRQRRRVLKLNSTAGATILINVAVNAESIECQMWCLDMRTGGSGRQYPIHRIAGISRDAASAVSGDDEFVVLGLSGIFKMSQCQFSLHTSSQFCLPWIYMGTGPMCPRSSTVLRGYRLDIETHEIQTRGHRWTWPLYRSSICRWYSLFRRLTN